MNSWLRLVASYFLPPLRADYHSYTNLFVHELSKKISSLKALFKTADSTALLSESDRQWASQLTADAAEILRLVLPVLVRLSSRLALPYRLYKATRRLENPFASCSTRGEEPEVKSPDRFAESATNLEERIGEIAKFYDEVRKSVEATDRTALSDVAKKSLEKIRAEKFSVISQHSIELSGSGGTEADRFFLSPAEARHYEHVLTNLLRNAIEAVEQKNVGAGFQSLLENARDTPRVSLVFENLPDSGLTLSVEDTGIGMDKETSRRFAQKGFSAGKPSGQGMGLTEGAFRACKGFVRYDVSSTPGVGTKITLFLSRPFLRQYLRRSLVLRWGVVMTGTIVMVAGLTLLARKTFEGSSKPYKEPVCLRVENGYTLAVIDADSAVLWRMGFESIASEIRPFRREDEINGLVSLRDLKGDGKKEVLFALQYRIEAKKADTLFCYDLAGTKLWEFSPGRDSIYDTEIEFDSPNELPFTIGQILLDRSRTSGSLIIVRSQENGPNFPNEIAVLTVEGNPVKRYWFPGGMSCDLIDFDKDGDNEIIIWGCNQRYGWRGFWAILDIDSLPALSQGFPYRSIDKVLDPAKEAVCMLLPYHTAQKTDAENLMDRVMNVLVYSDRVRVSLEDGRIYNFNIHSLSLIKLAFNYIQHKSNNMHKGKDYSFTTSDLDTLWKEIEIYRWGKRVR